MSDSDTKYVVDQVTIVPPIEKGNKGKCVWQKGVKDNILSRNQLHLVDSWIATYDGIVDNVEVYNVISWPVIVPIWLRVKFNCEVEQDEKRSGGYRYKIFKPTQG